MRIGTMRVDPIIDGEILSEPAMLYPSVDPREFEPYRGLLDPITGSFVQTLGGYLVRTGDRVVLVDAGIGSKAVYPFTGGGLRSSLLALGVRPEDITDVLFTHLHIDHIGWVTQNGRPFFPNAALRCDKRDWDFFVTSGRETEEWELAMSHPDEDPAPIRFGPVAAEMEFWSGGAEVLPGIEALDAAGHTPGTTVFLLSSGDERGALLGDLAHTQPELLNGWEFMVHADPAEAVRSITKFRDWLAAERIPCAAAHFPGMRWGQVTRTESGHEWVDLADQA
ncbi:MAG TPA: MBL fold metallo-hydrolase [Amycolatopsis sp.]|nr:MBL fold metallo-hydrolase [Amycolatopsis sp.]